MCIRDRDCAGREGKIEGEAYNIRAEERTKKSKYRTRRFLIRPIRRFLALKRINDSAFLCFVRDGKKQFKPNRRVILLRLAVAN